MAPEIPIVAWHEAIDLKEHRLPQPKPPIVNREDDSENTGAPDK